MLFTLQRIGLDYAERAPGQVSVATTVDASPTTVFDVLTGDHWTEWFPDMLELTVIPPRGVGGGRHARLRHSEAYETFLAWDPGRRFAFSVDRSNRPFLKAMMVDWRLSAAPGGRGTRVELRWDYTLRAWWRPMQFLVTRAMRKLIADALAGLKEFTEKRARAS
jgi:uncharacterized protein YndB with AHSA1/START domain